jgi:hypothetical protein
MHCRTSIEQTIDGPADAAGFVCSGGESGVLDFANALGVPLAPGVNLSYAASAYDVTNVVGADTPAGENAEAVADARDERRQHVRSLDGR